MKLFVVIAVVSHVAIMVRADWTPDEITGYFQFKGVHHVDAFVCSVKDGIRLMRHAYQPDVLGNWSISVSISKIWKAEQNRDRRIGIFFDTSCERNVQLLEGSERKWFDVIYSWLIWDSSERASKLNLNISLYSDVVVYNGQFHQAIKFISSAPMETRQIGHSEGSDHLAFPEIHPNLGKAVINGVLYAVMDIYNASNMSAQLLDMSFKHGYDSGNRFFYKLCLLVADQFNFTINVKKSNDWGLRSKNGTWTGIINDLRQGHADISFTPLLPISERLEHTFATPSLQKYWFALIFKQPRALGTYKAMTLELTGTVWALVGVSTLAGAVVFSLTIQHTNVCATLDAGILQAVGIFANQGLNILPLKNSSRIACLTLLLVGLFVSNYYNAATMTALLSEAPPTIKNLKEFIASDVKIALLNASYNLRPYGRSKVFRPGLRERVEKKYRVVNVEGGLDALRKGEAFCGEYYILFEGINEYMKDDEKCALTVFSSTVTYTSMRFIRQDKHLLEMFSRGLIKTLERGLVTKERDDWIAGPPYCFRTVPFIHVKLESVSVALGIFLVGLIFSAMVFICELLYNAKSRKRVEQF